MATDQLAEVRARLLTGALRRHKGLIAALGLIALVLGLAAGFVAPNTYTATATVLVNPLEGNPFSPQGRGDDLINLQTEAQLVATDPVTRSVAKAVGGGDLEDLRPRVSVVVPPNTQVLEISFAARDADTARDGAQAFATAYLDYRKQRAEDVLQGRVDGLREQMRKVEGDLEKTTQQRAMAAAGTSQAAYLAQRISAYVDQLSVLNEQISDAESTPIEPGQVITPAVLPNQPGVPGVVIFAVGGLVAGLALGLAVAVTRELRDDRIHDVQTLERVGATVLSEIPKTRDDEGIVVLTAPTEEAGEAYRRLRASVVATIPKTPVVLLVASITRGRSAVLTSANLAVALSRTAVTTILVDAHSTGPSPSHLFRLSQSPGLSNVLLDGADPVTLLVQTSPSLRLLPAGTDPSEGAERYPGPRMREAIDVLRSRSDVVIVCAPSIQEADGQALCAVADAALLVVSLDSTTTDELAHATAEVERCGAVVLGTVAKHGGMGRPAKPSSSNRPGAVSDPTLAARRNGVDNTPGHIGVTDVGGAATGSYAPTWDAGPRVATYPGLPTTGPSTSEAAER